MARFLGLNPTASNAELAADVEIFIHAYVDPLANLHSDSHLSANGQEPSMPACACCLDADAQLTTVRGRLLCFDCAESLKNAVVKAKGAADV